MTKDFWSLSPEAYGTRIPFIVSDLINEMEARKAIDVQGIFRLAASDVETKKLIEEFRSGKVKNLSEYNIHTIATTLKRYFRGMAETAVGPLISIELYACIIAIMKFKGDESYLVRELKPMMKGAMSDSRYKTLCYTCRFLKKLSGNSANNLMTPDNLAICIAPNILVTPDDSADALQNSGYVNKAMSSMIKCCDELFDIELCDDDFCTEAWITRMETVDHQNDIIEHLMARCQARKGSLVPFVPICRSDPKLKRPSEPPNLDSEVPVC